MPTTYVVDLSYPRIYWKLYEPIIEKVSFVGFKVQGDKKVRHQFR